MKKKAVGETWEKTTKGVTYLMQAQETGRAKAIKRLTPYTCKNKANTKSKIEQTMNGGTKEPPKPYIRKSGKIKDPNYDRLNPFHMALNKGVSAKPFNPNTHVRVYDPVKRGYVERLRTF
jgi:hypothetical protein